MMTAIVHRAKSIAAMNQNALFQPPKNADRAAGGASGASGSKAEQRFAPRSAEARWPRLHLSPVGAARNQPAVRAVPVRVRAPSVALPPLPGRQRLAGSAPTRNRAGS